MDAQPYVAPALKGTTACGAKSRTCLTCGKHKREHGTTACDFVPRPCPNPAMPNGRCQIHGGKSVAPGIGHQLHKGKGRSIVLPHRMLADYHEARTSPDRLSLEAEIAELRAMKADCWRMLEGDAAIAVSQVRAAYSAFSKAYDQAENASRHGNAERLAEAFTAIGHARDDLRAALHPIEAMEAAKRQVADLNVKVEKLLKTENARIIDERGMVSLEAALADRHVLVLACLGAITKRVHDPEIQKAIRREIGDQYARLTGRRDAAPADAAGGVGIIDVEHTVAADG